jgi:hypothetical protein
MPDSYSLDQVLQEVKAHARELAENLNVMLNFPELPVADLKGTGDQQTAINFLCKCMSFAIQCGNHDSMINVHLFHDHSRLSIEISFISTLCNEATFKPIIDKLEQFSPAGIELHFKNGLDSPSSLLIDITTP